jgi:hypothetical protein
MQKLTHSIKYRPHEDLNLLYGTLFQHRKYLVVNYEKLFCIYAVGYL